MTASIVTFPTPDPAPSTHTDPHRAPAEVVPLDTALRHAAAVDDTETISSLTTTGAERLARSMALHPTSTRPSPPARPASGPAAIVVEPPRTDDPVVDDPTTRPRGDVPTGCDDDERPIDVPVPASDRERPTPLHRPLTFHPPGRPGPLRTAALFATLWSEVEIGRRPWSQLLRLVVPLGRWRLAGQLPPLPLAGSPTALPSIRRIDAWDHGTHGFANVVLRRGDRVGALLLTLAHQQRWFVQRLQLPGTTVDIDLRPRPFAREELGDYLAEMPMRMLDMRHLRRRTRRRRPVDGRPVTDAPVPVPR